MQVSRIRGAADEAWETGRLGGCTERMLSSYGAGVSSTHLSLVQDLLRLRDDHRRLEADSTSAREEAEDQENALRLRMQHMKRQVADAEARVQEVEAQKAKLVPATTLMVRSTPPPPPFSNPLLSVAIFCNALAANPHCHHDICTQTAEKRIAELTEDVEKYKVRLVAVA